MAEIQRYDFVQSSSGFCSMEKMPVTGRYIAFSDLATYVEQKAKDAVKAERERCRRQDKKET